MSLFKKSQDRVLYESELFRRVAEEIERGYIHKGLWAKAKANTASANQEVVQAEYIRLRAEHLEAEHGAETKQIEPEANRQTKAETDERKKRENFVMAIFLVLLAVTFLIELLK